MTAIALTPMVTPMVTDLAKVTAKVTPRITLFDSGAEGNGVVAGRTSENRPTLSTVSETGDFAA